MLKELFDLIAAQGEPRRPSAGAGAVSQAETEGKPAAAEAVEAAAANSGPSLVGKKRQRPAEAAADIVPRKASKTEAAPESEDSGGIKAGAPKWKRLVHEGLLALLAAAKPGSGASVKVKALRKAAALAAVEVGRHTAGDDEGACAAFDKALAKLQRRGKLVLSGGDTLVALPTAA